MTTTMWVILFLVIGLMIFFALFLSMTAGRLDRLHKRIDVAELALDAQLLRRSGIALELAACGLLDPAASVVLSESAHAARRSSDLSAAEQDLVESNLTASLNAALDADDYAEVMSEQGGPELLAELSAAVKRVELSRRFLNDAVRACTQLRRQRTVRWFHLAGRTPWPVFREMSDHVDLLSG